MRCRLAGYLIRKRVRYLTPDTTTLMLGNVKQPHLHKILPLKSQAKLKTNESPMKLKRVSEHLELRSGNLTPAAERLTTMLPVRELVSKKDTLLACDKYIKNTCEQSRQSDAESFDVPEYQQKFRAMNQN